MKKMMRLIIIVLLLIISFNSDAQHLKNGMEWWYSNTETFSDTLKEGYLHYLITGDTLIDGYNFKLVAFNKVNSQNKTLSNSKLIFKEDTSVVYYRSSLLDTAWYYAYHHKAILNSHLRVKIKGGIQVKKDTIVDFTISEINNVTISGNVFQTYRANIQNDKLDLYSDLFYSGIGGKYLLTNPLIAKGVADYNIGGPIRCYIDGTNLKKFESIACDSVLFGIPHYTNSDEKITSEVVLNIFPNPFHSEIRVEISPISKNDNIQILNLFGEEIYSATIQSKLIDLKLPNLSSGIYFIQIANGKKITFKKVIKQ